MLACCFTAAYQQVAVKISKLCLKNLVLRVFHILLLSPGDECFWHYQISLIDS